MTCDHDFIQANRPGFLVCTFCGHERTKYDESGTFKRGQPIGLKDASGREIRLGDRVLYRREGKFTKREFWNPEYEVVYDAPCFTLRHVGGGKDAGSNRFKLRNGGRHGHLVILRSTANG